jgi:hypothetical protein
MEPKNEKRPGFEPVSGVPGKLEAGLGVPEEVEAEKGGSFMVIAFLPY